MPPRLGPDARAAVVASLMPLVCTLAADAAPGATKPAEHAAVDHPGAREPVVQRPDLEVEGDMQANVAVDYALQKQTFPFTRLGGAAGSFVAAQACDIDAFKRFFHACLKRGLYWAPSAYECGFTSSTHSAEVIAETLKIAAEAFAEIAGSK